MICRTMLLLVIHPDSEHLASFSAARNRRTRRVRLDDPAMADRLPYDQRASETKVGTGTSVTSVLPASEPCRFTFLTSASASSSRTYSSDTSLSTVLALSFRSLRWSRLDRYSVAMAKHTDVKPVSEKTPGCWFQHVLMLKLMPEVATLPLNTLRAPG